MNPTVGNKNRSKSSAN
ncbi:hypothetical protein RSAG8_03264, partial [Rhizoctonia solani AG-8 WAC10335]